jgi:hypothetical protein
MTCIQFTFSHSIVSYGSIKLPRKEADQTAKISATPDSARDLSLSTDSMSAQVEKRELPESKRHRSGSKNFDRSILGIFVVCSVVQ